MSCTPYYQEMQCNNRVLMRKLTDKGLTTKLDDVVRDIVRKRDLDWRGYGKCVTCFRTFPASKLQVGHYISRRHHSVRWHLRNVALQCEGCNGFMNGRPEVYVLELIKKYGVEFLEKLEKEKQKTLSYHDKWLLLEELKDLLKVM